VPKRCHRRPSPRCLLGQLGGDVMPKPCHKRLSLRCLPAKPTLAETAWHTRLLARGQPHPQHLRPAGTCRQALHVPRWGTARAMLSATAQRPPADTLGTIVPGTRSASSSASPPSRQLPTGSLHCSSLMAIIPPTLCPQRNQSPSRHLPTHSAHSFLARGPRHPQRLRPADTCRDSRHTRSR
jgi:hypothetical protein